MQWEDFFSLHPKLYHMAWEGAWPSIVKHGLLSTEALLDLYDVTGERRSKILATHRAESVRIEHPQYGTAMIRDQKPMNDTKLSRCLTGGLKPADWYRLLNSKVFFWTTPGRLCKMVSAGPYKQFPHCILTLDTRKVVEDYRDKITFSPINSGATRFANTLRGLETFTRFEDFPYEAYRRKGRPRNDIFVELTVHHGVNDIGRYVENASIVQGVTTLELLYP